MNIVHHLFKFQICSWESISQYSSIGSDNGLTVIRRLKLTLGQLTHWSPTHVLGFGGLFIGGGHLQQCGWVLWYFQGPPPAMYELTTLFKFGVICCMLSTFHVSSRTVDTISHSHLFDILLARVLLCYDVVFIQSLKTVFTKANQTFIWVRNAALTFRENIIHYLLCGEQSKRLNPDTCSTNIIP